MIFYKLILSLNRNNRILPDIKLIIYFLYYFILSVAGKHFGEFQDYLYNNNEE